MECQKQELNSVENGVFQELVSTLPEEKRWGEPPLNLYQGIWISGTAIRPITSLQKHFEAHDTDIILASIPKSGTTWLKALIYLITNRSTCPLNKSPLLTSNPHNLVPFLEFELFLKNQCPDLEKIPNPRIFATHLPYDFLANSITDPNSSCKIVYICRNPLDQFTSFLKFASKYRPDSLSLSLDEAFELYCKGIHLCGPFWNHMLGYWYASQKNPDKFLFLRYEDLKQEYILHTKRLAEFLGFPFSIAEEEQGILEEICSICSFENLKNLEVNKNGKHPSLSDVPNSSFFRKGEVGDWSNYLTPLMADQMNKLLQEKLNGSGLIFDLFQDCKIKKES